MQTYFEVIQKFMQSSANKKYKISIGLWKQIFVSQSYFFTETIKQSQCQLFFRTFIKKAYKAIKILGKGL